MLRFLSSAPPGYLQNPLHGVRGYPYIVANCGRFKRLCLLSGASGRRTGRRNDQRALLMERCRLRRGYTIAMARPECPDDVPEGPHNAPVGRPALLVAPGSLRWPFLT